MKLAILSLVFCSPALAQWSTDQLPQRRTMQGAAAVGSSVYFAGGLAPPEFTGTLSDAVWAYDVQSAQWSSVGQLSEARFRPLAAAAGEWLVVAGGHSTGGWPTATVDRYNTTTGQWVAEALPSVRSEMAVASSGELAFFAGGFLSGTADKSDIIDVFDASTQTWSQLTLGMRRARIGATSVGTKVLFAGGNKAGAIVFASRVDIYNTDSGTWNYANLSVPRMSVAATSVGDLALFAGGADGSAAGSDVVDIYDARTNSWSTATLSQRRAVGVATSAGGKAYFVGGWTVTGESDVVDIYDLATGTWSVETLSQKRSWLSGAAAAGVAVFAGGNNPNDSYSSRVDIRDDRVGVPYCSPAVPNSTGQPASLRAAGSPFAGGEPLTLLATELPLGQWGYFITSPMQDFQPGAGGSVGTLCLGSPAGRYSAQTAMVALSGTLTLAIDTLDLPVPGGAAALPGDTWNFQLWYRDGAGTSNFSDAVAVTFQ